MQTEACSVKCVGTISAIKLQIVKYSQLSDTPAAAVSLSPLPEHLLAAGTACAETKKFHIHVLCKLSRSMTYADVIICVAETQSEWNW